MDPKRTEAIKFLQSARGQYIIGQALYKAIEVMQKEPYERREISNINDMIYLMETLFPIFAVTELAMKEFKQRNQSEKGGV